MDQNTAIALISIGGTVCGAVFTYRVGRNANKVGQERNYIERVNAAEAKADRAETKADEAEAKAAETVRRMTACQRQMEEIELRLVAAQSRVRYIVAMIHDPYITIDVLRERVPADFHRRQ